MDAASTRLIETIRAGIIGADHALDGPYGSRRGYAQPAARKRAHLQPSVAVEADIAFGFAGELWIVPRAGGVAPAGHGADAQRSADVFARQDPDRVHGRLRRNPDVFVVAATGGEPAASPITPAATSRSDGRPTGRASCSRRAG
jgi:hypothetical protein